MARRNAAIKKDVLPDPIYNSKLITKVVNQVMQDGKKALAQQIVYGALDIVKEKTGAEAIEHFNQAIENIKPMLETKGRRVGSATYQVPMEVRPERRQTLAVRWLVTFARRRNGERTMKEKLAGEIMDAFNNSGAAVRKKDEMHRMAEANKAFAHYRW